MLAHSKAALIALALIFACSPVLAQDDPADPPSDSRGGPDGGWQRGAVRHEGRMDGRGDWSRDRDGWGGGRGQRFGRGMGGGERGFGERQFGLSHLLNDPSVRDKIGVSADQAAKIRDQASTFRKAEIRGRADLQIKQIELRDLLAADKPDRPAIDAKLQEISASRLEMQKSAIDFRLASRDALTPAQRDKLRQLIEDRRHPEGGPGPRGAGARRGGQRGSAPPPPPAGTQNNQPPPSH